MDSISKIGNTLYNSIAQLFSSIEKYNVGKSIYKFPAFVNDPNAQTFVQVAFSFDTTGSMTAYLAEVRQKIQYLTKKLIADIPNIKISIISHGDYCDEGSSYIIKMLDFSDDIDAIDKFISQQCTNTGGGDYPECYELVLKEAQTLSWNESAAKALVIIGDAPPHKKDEYWNIDWEEEIKFYPKNNIHVYGIKCGHDSYSFGRHNNDKSGDFYEQIALRSGGFLIKLQDVNLMPELFTELCYREQQKWALTQMKLPNWDVSVIKDKKIALINITSSLLLHEPKYHESTETTQTKINLLCNALIEEGNCEFIFKFATYCRLKIGLRATSNYLFAYAASFDCSNKYISIYLPFVAKLPSDLLEIVNYYKSIKQLTNIKFSKSFQKAIQKLFLQYNSFGISKHAKNKHKNKKAKGKKKVINKTENEIENKKENEMEIEKEVEKEIEKEANMIDKELESVNETTDDNKPIDNKPTDNKNKPVDIKTIIRLCHVTKPKQLIMETLGKKYPSTEEEFIMNGFSGRFDPLKANKRMKLQIPFNWETQISANGNKANVWESLLDSNAIPFMATLRNLRNMISAGISDKHHQMIINKLTDEKQIIKSMQFPYRFLSAYLAIQEARNNANGIITLSDRMNVRPTQHKRRKTNKTRRPNEIVETNETHQTNNFDDLLFTQYETALNTAIKLSAMNNLPPLYGKTVVLCDVSGSMRYNECVTTKGIASVRNASDLAILLSLTINYMSIDCSIALFAEKFVEIHPNKEIILQEFTRLKDEIGELGLLTEFPIEYLQTKSDISTIILISDMLIGQHRTHPGGGKLTTFINEYRQSSNPSMKFVCIDLFGSGTTYAGVDENKDQTSPNDILITGFSDYVLKYIAIDDSNNSQLNDIENILNDVKNIDQNETNDLSFDLTNIIINDESNNQVEETKV